MSAVTPETALIGQALLNERSRGDFRLFQALMQPTVSSEPYVDAAHLRAIAWKLQQVAAGKIRRLLIAVPPRHFKSFQTSIAFPAFMLGQNPALKIICASYGAELADTFANGARTILQSPRYAAIFPKTRLTAKSPPLHNQRTTAGGYRYTTSIGGPLTGLGADILILDDPLKAAEAGSQVTRDAAYDWLKASAMTRFDKPAEGVVIVVMQRLHQDDVLGRLKAEQGWDLLELPAEALTTQTFATGPHTSVTLKPGEILFPARFDAQVLAERKAELGEAAYHAQYLQRPTPPGGHLFKMKRFGRFELKGNNAVQQYEQVILSMDPGVSSAPTSDYTAVSIWGVRGPDLYLLKVERGRWTLSEQLNCLRKWREKLQGLLIERSHSGIMLMETLRSESGTDEKLIGYTPRLEKLVRAEFAANFVEKGIVHLPHDAPWLEAFELELASFPHGTHDDQVDSFSQLVFNLRRGMPYWLPLSAYPPQGLVHVTFLGG